MCETVLGLYIIGTLIISIMLVAFSPIVNGLGTSTDMGLGTSCDSVCPSALIGQWQCDVFDPTFECIV